MKAKEIFQLRGNEDEGLFEFLEENSYQLYRHKKTNVIYGSCLGAVVSQDSAYGIFEIIPLLQCYVIVNIKSGIELEFHGSKYFHDADIVFNIRPADPSKGDFVYAYVGGAEKSDQCLIEIQEVDQGNIEHLINRAATLPEDEGSTDNSDLPF